MLCERLTNVSKLADRGYIAEPKLDGQRAQLMSTRARQSPATADVASTSWSTPVWRGSRHIEWPSESAIFDGEACAAAEFVHDINSPWR